MKAMSSSKTGKEERRQINRYAEEEKKEEEAEGDCTWYSKLFQ